MIGTTVNIGSKIGNWTVVELQDRRVICQCVCGNFRSLFVAALVDGSAATSCGCRALSRQQRDEQYAEVEQRQRRRDRDWRPGER